jgi:hypothetical protein
LFEKLERVFRKSVAPANTMAKGFCGLLLLFGIGAVLLHPSLVLADPLPAQSGISIGPFEESLSLQPSNTQKSYALQFVNHTTTAQTLALSTTDFGSLNDSGGIALGDGTSFAQTYGLTEWLSLSANSIQLPPGGQAAVTVTVRNDSSLQPGGHYGAIVASVMATNQSTGSHVSVSQQLTSLLLVDKQGGDHYDLSLPKITQNGNWLHLPSSVQLTFYNPGNVHVVPRGLVQLKNSRGRVVAQGIINTESAFILPGTNRLIYVPMTTVSNDLHTPGRYTLVASYRYDGITRYAVEMQSLDYINLQLYFFGLIILVLFAGCTRSAARYRKRHYKKRNIPPVEPHE